MICRVLAEPYGEMNGVSRSQLHLAVKYEVSTSLQSL